MTLSFHSASKLFRTCNRGYSYVAQSLRCLTNDSAWTSVKVFISIEPVDFRKAFKGPSGIVRSLLENDPLSGHVFVFRSKRGDAIKMICFDGRACWTGHAKFAKGRLSWWPSVSEIQGTQLMSLISQSSEVAPLLRFEI